MAQPYVGEIRMFAGNFAPAGWAFCDGAPMPIGENATLFNLIGTTYGGDGQNTFNLPDLRGRAPVHAGTVQGTDFTLAESGGVEQVTLTVNQIPVHTHALLATPNTASSSSPANAVFAAGSSITLYTTDAPISPLAAGTISATGGSQAHMNMQPFLAVNYIISLFGIYPTPT